MRIIIVASLYVGCLACCVLLLRNPSSTPRWALVLVTSLVFQIVAWAFEPVRRLHNPVFWFGTVSIAVPSFYFLFAALGPWKTKIDRAASVVGFLAAAAGYILFWTVVYQRAESASPDCIVPGFAHHIDSLYFALTTFTTIGFGDVHASSQTCRWLVSSQMVADILVVGIAVAGIGSRLVGRSE
jgi:Ion channel